MELFLPSAILAEDLGESVSAILAGDPHYFVPVPRKAIKLQKLYGDIMSPVASICNYTTAFYWSPTLSNLGGKRVAILDDATARGVTLRRHRARFESQGAHVDTFAVYKSSEDVGSSRVRPAGFAPDRATRITRWLSQQEYDDYTRLVQDTLRGINPLLEHDHFRFVAEFNDASGLEAVELFDLASVLGEPIGYPYNVHGPVLGATVIHPDAGGRLDVYAKAIGIDSLHAKVRLYFNTITNTLTIVPMVFPACPFLARPFNGDRFWDTLATVCGRSGAPALPAWQGAHPPRARPRLVYEFVSYAMSSMLLAYCKEEPTLSRLIDMSAAHRADCADHSRRFGPELAQVATFLATDRRGCERFLDEISRAFFPQRNLRLSTPTRVSPRVGSPEISLYDLCRSMVQGLTDAYQSADPALRRDPLDDRVGWTFPEISARYANASPELVSEAIDYLCDNGYLVPFYEYADDLTMHFSRRYRTSELTDVARTFNLAKEFLAFVLGTARRVIPQLSSGVPLTLANKLTANILLDLIGFLSREEVSKLQALTVDAGMFGPECKLCHLMTAHSVVRLTHLVRHNWQLSRIEDGAAMPTRGLVEPAGPHDLRGFQPSTAALIEDLTRVYCEAFVKLGGTVSDVLLPLSMYRRREEAYRFLHADLTFWVSHFLSATDCWDQTQARTSSLQQAHEAIEAFFGKLEQGTSFGKLWKRFIALAERRSNMLAVRLKDALDSSASDMSQYSELESVAEVCRIVQRSADSLANGDRPQFNLSAFQVIALLEQQGHSDVAVELSRIHHTSDDEQEWLRAALNGCAALTEALPHPLGHLEALRRQRLYDGNITRQAIRAAQARGETEVIVVMGDLRHSKQLERAVSKYDLSYVDDVIEVFYKRLGEILSPFNVEHFHNPHGDDFNLFMFTVESAFSFASRLYADAVRQEESIRALIGAAELDPAIRIAPKLGILRCQTMDRQVVERHIHTCSQLIASEPPMVNRGELLARISERDIPLWARPVARPHKRLGDGPVFSFQGAGLVSALRDA